MIVRDHLPWDRVWPRIWRRLVLLFLFDLTVSVLYTFGLTKLVSFPALPVLPMGSVLSIFLAFRTNSACGRWWEARQLWGQLVNSSRSLARQAITFIQGGTSPAAISEEKRRIVHLQIAFVCALRCHLRRQNDALSITCEIYTARGLCSRSLSDMVERARTDLLFIGKSEVLRRKLWLPDIAGFTQSAGCPVICVDHDRTQPLPGLVPAQGAERTMIGQAANTVSGETSLRL